MKGIKTLNERGGGWMGMEEEGEREKEDENEIVSQETGGDEEGEWEKE